MFVVCHFWWRREAACEKIKKYILCFFILLCWSCTSDGEELYYLCCFKLPHYVSAIKHLLEASRRVNTER